MKAFTIILLGLLTSTGVSEAQQMNTINSVMGCANFFRLPNGKQVLQGSVSVTFPDWHVLADNSVVLQALNTARDQGYVQCGQGGQQTPEVMDVSVHAQNAFGIEIISSWWYRGDNQWRIVKNEVARLTEQENRRGAQLAAEKERQEREARKAEEQKEQAKQRQNSALADCGSSPRISGGPWFSSTYKIGALDAGKRFRSQGLFSCVKSIEYIGDAVNPFGGKAAKAKFIGYSARDYAPLSMDIDFPY